MLAGLAAVVALMTLPGAAQSTILPAPVVASSTTTVGTGLNQPQSVGVDAQGNVFVANAGAGNVMEFPANGGASVTVMSGLNYNKGLTVDSSGNVYSSSFNGNIMKWAAAGAANSGTQFTTGSSCPDFAAMGYYIGFFNLSVDGKGNIYALGGNSYILEFDQQGNCTERLTPAQLTGAPGAVAADAAGDLYYTLGGKIYYLPAGSTTSTPLSIASGAFQTINALAVDASGNLFVTDAASIDEIPMVNGTLQTADVTYLVSSGAASNIGISPGDVLYYGNYNANSVVKTVIGSLALGSSSVGATGTVGELTYTFNAQVAPTGFAFLSGANSTTQFAAAGSSTCTTGTVYPASTASAISSCTLDVTLTAATPGKITGVVQLDTAAGALSTTYLSGDGQGAGLTVDPGTQTSLGTFGIPAALAVDAAGDVFVADSANSTVTEIPAGGGTAVTVGSGLNAPQGLAVDPAGNLFIADTSNNRIVEVPMVGGSLSTAGQMVVASSLSAPLGLAVDLAGNVLIANSGAGDVLELPNQGGVVGALAPFAVGSGWQKPTAIDVDANGNVFVADATAANVVKLTPAGTQTAVLANVAHLAGLAVNANDDLFLTQSGSATVTKIAMVGGAYQTNATVALGTGLSGPQGIALDTAGDLFVADASGGAAYEIQRTLGALTFGKLNIGDTSASQTLMLSNTGNQPLTFAAPLFTSAGDAGDFAIAAASNNGCGASLATGVSCGVAATFTPTAAGARTETINFQSNAVNASPVSATLSGTGANSAPTTTTLTVSPTGTIAFGQTLTVTATIAPKTASAVTPTGTVQFSVDGTNFGSPVTLGSAGTAVEAVTGLGGGPHVINATYNGDDVYASSAATAPLNLTIAPAATTTTLTSTISGSTAVPTGTSATFTATVSPSGFAGPPNPSGSVSFYQAGNATALATAPLTNGVATFTTTTLPNGQYNVTAVYSGDTDFSTSTSAGYAVYVSPPTFVLSSTPASLSVPARGSASMTFTLTAIAGYTGTVIPTCSGLPSNTMCTFTPGAVAYTVTPGTQTVTLTVTTGTNTGSFAALYLLPSVLLLGGLLLIQRRRPLPKLLVIAMVIAGGIMASGSLTGCSTGATPPTPGGTATVNVQLLGSAAAPGGAAIKQNFSFTLQVQ
jgi:sugar lactone lactonase YvrE